MAEYIEREAAIETIKNLYPSMPLVKLNVDKWHEKNKAYMECEIAIEAIPAADVRPVVLGKWSIHEIYKHEMSYGVTGYEPVYKCSVCGRLMESYLRFDEPIMPEDASFPRFCPNCGAMMEES